MLFGEYDKQIVEYVRRLRRHGAKVDRTIVMGSARGIILRKAPQLLHERGGTKKITPTWARSLLKRIKFVKRKGTRKAKRHLGNEAAVGCQFHNMIHVIVTENNIPAALCVAADETFSNLLPTTRYTMSQQGESQVDLVALDDKRRITIFPAFSGECELLDPQLIYHGTTNQCHPDVDFPPGYATSHSKNHWSTQETVIEIIEKCFVPFFAQTRLRLGLSPEQWALLI